MKELFIDPKLFGGSSFLILCGDEKMFPILPKDVIYDGGGGPGLQNLSYSQLQDSQFRMFSRTVNQNSESHDEYLRQEKRQLIVREEPVHITVNVCREDFPSVQAPISLTFFPTAAQEVWGKFLSDVSKTLGVEFIHSIRDRTDKSPVFRVLRLKHNHDYLVRQRESSAVLEILNTGKTPLDFSWPITREISHAQKDLRYNLNIQDKVNDRIHDLVIKPMTHVDERDIVQRLLACERCDLIVHLISQVYLTDQDKMSMTKELSVRAVNINYMDTSRFDGKVDIVAIHRVAIEQLNRIIVKFIDSPPPNASKTATSGEVKTTGSTALDKTNDKDKKKGGGPDNATQLAMMVKQCIHYVLKVMSDLVNEVDIVAMALKFLTDIMQQIIPLREKVFPCILDSIQAYAPPAPIHRPRRPKRKQNTGNVEYKFDSAGGMAAAPAWLAPKISRQGPRSHIGPYGIDMSLEVNKFTRYGQYETLVYDRSMNRAASNLLELCAREIEIDENLRPITPRAKAKKKAEEEAERRRKAELEEILRSQREQEEEERAKRLALLNAGPRMIIRNRDRLDHSAAKQASDYVAQNAQKLSDIVTMAPDINQKNQAPKIKGSGEDESDDDDMKRFDRKDMVMVDESGVATLNDVTGGVATSTVATRTKLLEDMKSAANNPSTAPSYSAPSLPMMRTRSPLDGSRGGIIVLSNKDKDGNIPIVPLVNPNLITVPRAVGISGSGTNTEDQEVGTGSGGTSIASGLRSRPLSGVSAPPRRPLSGSSPSQSHKFSQEKEEAAFLPSLINNAAKKKPKFKIKVKQDNGAESTEEEGAASSTVATKKKWKGSKGEVGKAPPDQKEIDAKYQEAARAQIEKMKEEVGMINIEDINGDDGVEKIKKAGLFNIEETLPEDAAPPLIRPTSAYQQNKEKEKEMASELALAAAAGSSQPTDGIELDKPISEDGEVKESPMGNSPSASNHTSNQPSRRESLAVTANAVGETTDVAPAAAPAVVKKKKKKLVLEPLPDVPCPVFKGLADQMKENVVLVQGFATLLQMMLTCYGHREWAFKNNVLEEIAEVTLVCPSIPKILEYFMEIIHTLYTEGYIIPVDLHAEQLMDLQQLDDYTMVLSTNSLVSDGNMMNNGLNQNSINSHMTGKMIDYVSEMSIPTIGLDPNYQDHHFNRYQPLPDEERNQEFLIQEITSQGSKRSINALADKPERHSVKPDMIIQANPHELQPFQYGNSISSLPGRKKPARNREIVQSLGLQEFEIRYVQMPPDCVIMALSMCAAHVEVAMKHREQAMFWLEVFSDHTRDYQMLMRKGRNLCAL